MTFICTAKPAYNFVDTLTKLEPHKFADWKRRARSLGERLNDANQANIKEKIGHLWEGLLMDGDEVAAWDEAGVALEISRVKGLASNSANLAQVTYQIAVPSIGLLQIQRVEWVPDADADEIQRWLDRDWRILAICPPNDGGLPRVLFGHVDKEARS